MIGTTISHCKVLEKIGQGGMREVYRAEDTKLNRNVALKILPDRCGGHHFAGAGGFRPRVPATHGPA